MRSRLPTINPVLVGIAAAQGLVPALTGSASTSVLLFDAVADDGEGLVVAGTAADGTTFSITRAGKYRATLSVTVPANGDLEIGIGRNIVVPFTADPDLTQPGVECTTRITAPAATSIPGTLILPFEVSASQAAATVRINFLASDAAGSAPAAGDIVAANVTAVIMKVAEFGR